MQGVKDLLETLGKKQLAKEFSVTINGKGTILSSVKPFFNLFFTKNVPQYPFTLIYTFVQVITIIDYNTVKLCCNKI